MLGIVGDRPADTLGGLFTQALRQAAGARLGALPCERPADADPTSSMLGLLKAALAHQRLGADVVLLSSVAAHAHLAALRDNLRARVCDLFEASRWYLARAGLPGRIAVLAPANTRALVESGLCVPALECEFVFPDAPTLALFEKFSADPENGSEIAAEMVARTLEDGADLILPAFDGYPGLLRQLCHANAAVLPVHEIYADFAMQACDSARRVPKLGVVGGVGPAATVDFMAKLIAGTPASRDQDHLKMVIEHNPQIPDRTAAILGQGEDPTAALYSACAALVGAGATMIAIPCNTAHAFLGRIQPHIPVPILDMLAETARRIRAEVGAGARVGVLATDGTIASGLYQRALEHYGLVPLTPDGEHQRMVTEAIYGHHGIKAGYTIGECLLSLAAAASNLSEQGAAAIILGCTELPLAIRERAYIAAGGREIPYVDPTETLARACLAMAGRDVEATAGAGQILAMEK